MTRRALPGWISAPLAIGWFLTLAWMEHRRPLRIATEPKLRRNARNLAVAGVGAAAMAIAESPVVRPLTQLVERRRWGLLGSARLPVWLELPAALVMMDYTMYVWHVLTHLVPVLWRFHIVHHVDLGLDASTALRFHFGELIASVPWRVCQVVLIGITPLSFSVWQVAFLASILFHHSDVDLGTGWERRVNRFVVTPRMHGIHHSVIRLETNSNWSSGLTIWDRLHRTLNLSVPQSDVTIGVPAYREPGQVTLPRILAMPFGDVDDPGVRRGRLLLR